MMTFKDVEFVGGADSTIMGGGFCNQDYFVNFSNDYSLWLNLDCYDLAISGAAEQIDNFVASYGETISEEEINKAIEALKECYELNKSTLSRDGYISHIAELICNDTIKAEAWLEKYDDTTEVYVVNYTNNEDGSKDKVIAVWDKRTPGVVRFPEDWEMNIKTEDLLDNNGKVFIPEEYWFRPYCLINGQVTEC